MKTTLNVPNRTIFCHDNLPVLRGINSDSVDLVYLDPPFNSKKQWDAPIGTVAEGASFKDTWRASDVDDSWIELYRAEHPGLYQMLKGMELYADESDISYLSYMGIRIIEMMRVLKPSGSLYYHCDGMMSHYVKQLLDIVFGRKNFRNDIAWCYGSPGAPNYHFPRKHDSILYYGKTPTAKFNKDAIKVPHKQIKKKVKKFGEAGEIAKYRPAEELHQGKMPFDWWSDIGEAYKKRSEYIGYPTQKPLALLERIIKASSSPGDVVLDPFCGCATTCVAAERLGRKWIGIDVSIKAFELIQQRLSREFAQQRLEYEVVDVNLSTSPPVRRERAKGARGYEKLPTTNK